MKFFKHLVGLFSSKLAIAQGLYALFKLEAKLASLNILGFLIGLVLLFALFISFWLNAWALIGYLVFFLTNSVLGMLVATFLLNLILIIIACIYINIRFKRMSFKKTRACLTNLSSKKPLKRVN